MDDRDGPPHPAWAVAGGLVCGLITAGCIVSVLGSLAEYQVHDYADQDASIGLAGALIAVVVTVALFGAAGAGGLLRHAGRHAAVAVVLVPAAVVPLVTGAERNRLEAAVIWGAAAVVVHLLVAYAGRWRRWAAAGLVVPVAAAALLTWGYQHRWRAQKFEAVGLPLVVPELPGYRLTGTWAGRYSVSMALRDPAGQVTYAIIRSDSVVLQRPGGAPRTLRPGDGVTLRAVDGSELADYPDDATMSEPD